MITWAIEPGLFREDETRETHEIVSDLFPEDKIIKVPAFQPGSEERLVEVATQDVIPRVSLTNAQILRRLSAKLGNLVLNEKLDDRPMFASSWLPALREHALSSDAWFTDFRDVERHLKARGPLFVRPDSPRKVFAGRVFGVDGWQGLASWENEYRFVANNLNGDPFQLCMLAAPAQPLKEWRAIVAGGELISIAPYMKDGEPYYKDDEDQLEVLSYAIGIRQHDFFLNLFDYTLDIARTDAGFRVVEINGLPTASFYGDSTHVERVLKAIRFDHERNLLWREQRNASKMKLGRN